MKASGLPAERARRGAWRRRATIAAKPTAAGRSRTTRMRSARSLPLTSVAWIQASASTSTRAAGDERERRARRPGIAAVDQDRGEHAGAEVGRHRRQALGERDARAGPAVRAAALKTRPAASSASGTIDWPSARGRRAQRRPSRAAAARVEARLDGQRPHRRVERHHRLGALVLSEDEEQRQLLERRQPHARLAGQRPEQQRRADDRQVVGGHDAADAVHGVGRRCAARVGACARRRAGDPPRAGTAGSPTARRTGRGRCAARRARWSSPSSLPAARTFSRE